MNEAQHFFLLLSSLSFSCSPFLALSVSLCLCFSLFLSLSLSLSLFSLCLYVCVSLSLFLSHPMALCHPVQAAPEQTTDEFRNVHRNTNQNPEFSSRISFQNAHLKRNIKFDHSIFCFELWWPFRVSSFRKRAVPTRSSYWKQDARLDRLWDKHSAIRQIDMLCWVPTILQ